MTLTKTNRTKRCALIVGGGMYVTGRGGENDGTVGPGLLESARQGLIEEICLVTTSKETSEDAQRKLTDTAIKMKVSVEIKAYHKLSQAIDISKPKIAVIAVPDHLHYKIGKEILSHGIHCLMVKPLVSKLTEAKKLIALAKENKCFACVEYHKQFDESNKIIRDEYRSGALGDLLYILVHYSQRKSIPMVNFSSWSSRTNVFNYLGVHYVDLITWITQSKPIAVSAWGQKKYLKEKGIDTYDSIQTIIEWEGIGREQFTSTHITNWIDSNKSSAMSDQHIIVVGTNGRIVADQKNRGIAITTDNNSTQMLNPYFSRLYASRCSTYLEAKGYGIECIKEFVQDCIEIINGSTTLSKLEIKGRATFEKSLTTCSVLEATTRSLTLQRRIEIKKNI